AEYYRFKAIPTAAALTAAAGRACARKGLAAPAGPAVPNVAGGMFAAAAPAAPAAGVPAALPGAAPGPEAGGPGALVAALRGHAGGAAEGALAPAPSPAAAAAACGLAAPVAEGALLAPAGPAAPAAAPAAPAAAAVPAAGPLAEGLAPAGQRVMPPPASPGGDARIFAFARDVRGVRHADIRSMVALIVELPWPDWPVRGPRTLQWALQFLAQRSGAPTAHHQRWLAETGLGPESPGVEIHQMGCMVLGSAVTCDQVHATNLGHLELIARSAQVQEERRREMVAPSEPGAADRAVMMGSQELGGAACACPALRDHLAQELQREMAVAKERRKAREERALAGGVPGQPDPNGALRELLAGSALYPDGGGPTSPYVPDLVSWPEVSQPPAPLLGLLGERDSAALRGWRCQVLRGPETARQLRAEACPQGPYTDPALLRSPLDYASFLRATVGRSMLTFSPSQGRRGNMGIFLVPKKSGQPRVVFDTRLANCAFIGAPRTQLPSASAWGRLESGDVRFSIASADLDMAFYHMRVPEGMEEYFTLPPIPAKYLASHGIAAAEVEGESLLLPQVVVLPMGFSWALHLCQAVLQTSLGRAGFSPGDLILDGHCGCQLTDDPDSVVGAGYVDNYFVLGGSPKTVSARLQAIADVLTRHGLAVHELVAHSQDRDFLGLSLREGRWLSPRTRNIWRSRAAIRAALRRHVISGFLLRVLTGHITWALLLRRELLCILGAAYAYIEATGPTAAPLWPTVRHELQLIHDLLPLCTAARSRTVGLNFDASDAPLGDVVADLGDDARVSGDGIDDYSLFVDVQGGALAGPWEMQSPGPPRNTDKSILDMRPAVDFDEVAGCWLMRRLVSLLALSQMAAGARRLSAPAPSALRTERARHARELAAETATVAGPSLLELLAVRSSTTRLYRGALANFVVHCAGRRLDWTSHAGLDQALVEFMDSEFLVGGGGDQGNVLLAAVAHFLGSFHKRTPVLLPRAHRAAAAWARRAPARTRLPLPRRVVFALAGLLIHDGFPRLAICIFVMFTSYLRPGGAAKLCGRHLVAPSEAAGPGYQFFGLLLRESGQEPGKTGVNDESILFDREAWLTPLLLAPKLSTAPSEPLR
ncbi:unnamed protein product, partial [Prorocentrum cordatum]